MINRLARTEIQNGYLSTPVCFAVGNKNDKPFRYWFIVLRTTVTEKDGGLTGTGGTHFLNLQLKNVQGPLHNFPLIYTSAQIIQEFGDYLQQTQNDRKGPCFDVLYKS